MKMPATARRRRIAASLYHDDALTDGLADARGCVGKARAFAEAATAQQLRASVD
jgi:hypothetical protein